MLRLAFHCIPALHSQLWLFTFHRVGKETQSPEMQPCVWVSALRLGGRVSLWPGVIKDLPCLALRIYGWNWGLWITRWLLNAAPLAAHRSIREWVKFCTRQSPYVLVSDMTHATDRMTFHFRQWLIPPTPAPTVAKIVLWWPTEAETYKTNWLLRWSVKLTIPLWADAHSNNDDVLDERYHPWAHHR